MAVVCSFHLRSPKSASKERRRLRLGCFPLPDKSHRVKVRNRALRFVDDNRGCLFLIQGSRISMGKDR